MDGQLEHLLLLQVRHDLDQILARHFSDFFSFFYWSFLKFDQTSNKFLGKGARIVGAEKETCDDQKAIIETSDLSNHT